MLWCLLGAKYVWREVGCASEKLPETKFELHSFCFILFFDKASCGSEKTDKSFFSLTLLVFSLGLHYLCKIKH